jgi:hypothetical protein
VKKIPTIFVRDETVKGHPVVDQVKPECQWVLDGEGIPTLKLDGTNVKVEGGQLFKRQKPKDRDYDEASYVPCRRDDPADKWAFEAFDALVEPGGLMHSDVPPADGIYELVGPKVQGNPYGYAQHELVLVVPPASLRISEAALGELTEPRRTFAGLWAFLKVHSQYEGLVFHHPDGRMAKIKRRDFGLPWPVKE